MKKYNVNLIFDGNWVIQVEAKNEEEAKELVMSGEFDQSDIIEDNSKQHFVEEVTKV